MLKTNVQCAAKAVYCVALWWLSLLGVGVGGSVVAAAAADAAADC